MAWTVIDERGRDVNVATVEISCDNHFMASRYHSLMHAPRFRKCFITTLLSIAVATGFASPVSITTWTPIACRRCTASVASGRMASATLSHRDFFGPNGKRDDFGIHQRVVEDDVRPLKQPGRTQRQQVQRARTGADEIHRAVHTPRASASVGPSYQSM